MLIAIDYDWTWSAAPQFFREVVQLGRQFGYEFLIVTNRPASRDVGDVAGLRVIYCDGRPKKYVTALHGINVNIWIDDLPHLVDFGSGNPHCQAMGLS